MFHIILTDSRKRGFTLIELLVVISIIALLVSILLPALNKARLAAKVVVCSSNQHQLLVGVMSYETDFGKLPPSTQGNYGSNPDKSVQEYYWSIPCRLVYHSRTNGSAGGSVYGVLGSYLQDAAVFNCPGAPPSSDSTDVSDSQGILLSYQQFYEIAATDEPIQNSSGNTDPALSCSYWLLWGFYGFDNDVSEVRFEPPGKGNKNTLVVSDHLRWNDSTNSMLWRSTHPYEGGSTMGNIYFEVYDTEETFRDDFNVNAGYCDGRVVRVRGRKNFVRERITATDYCYIPEKFR